MDLIGAKKLPPGCIRRRYKDGTVTWCPPTWETAKKDEAKGTVMGAIEDVAYHPMPLWKAALLALVAGGFGYFFGKRK